MPLRLGCGGWQPFWWASGALVLALAAGCSDDPQSYFAGPPVGHGGTWGTGGATDGTGGEAGAGRPQGSGATGGTHHGSGGSGGSGGTHDGSGAASGSAAAAGADGGDAGAPEAGSGGEGASAGDHGTVDNGGGGHGGSGAGGAPAGGSSTSGGSTAAGGSTGGDGTGGTLSSGGAGGTLSTGGAGGTLSSGGDAGMAGDGAAGEAGLGGAGAPAAGGEGGASGSGDASGGMAGGSGCVRTEPGYEVCDGIDNDCDGTVDGPGVCPDGCFGATFQAHRYLLCGGQGDSYTRPQARTGCDDASGYLGVTFDLATIDSAEEQAFLADLLDADGMLSPAWMSASDASIASVGSSEGNWVWGSVSNGGVFYDSSGPVPGRYNDWAPGQPDNGGSGASENCAVLDPDYGWQWDDVRCIASAAAFVCEETQP